MARSQVALAWALFNPAVVAPIMGARAIEQAKDSSGALDVSFTPDQIERQDSVSAPSKIFRIASSPADGSTARLRRVYRSDGEVRL